MNTIMIAIIGMVSLQTLIHVVRYILDNLAIPKNSTASMQDIYTGHEYKRMKSYHTAYTNYMIGKQIIAMSVTIIFLYWGYGWLDLHLNRLFANSVVVGSLFIISVFTIEGVFRFPLDLHQKTVLDKRFGLSILSISDFAKVKLKILLVSLPLGAVLLAGILSILIYVPTKVIIISVFLLIPILVMGSWLYTRVIVPITIKTFPLPDGEVKTVIQEYLHKNQPHMLHNISVFKNEGTRANVTITGSGSNARIILYKSTYDQFTPQQILAFVAHEIGHSYHNHLRKNIPFAALIAAFVFGGFMYIYKSPFIFAALELNPSAHMAVIITFILFQPVLLLFKILQNFILRYQEKQADLYAIQTLGTSEHLISGLKKLFIFNLTPPYSSLLTYYINEDHPTLRQRIDYLRRTDEKQGQV